MTICAPLLGVPGVLYAEELPTTFAEKERILEVVYNDIANAFGNPRKPPLPVLEVRGKGGRNKIAWTTRDPLKITIEEETFDLCFEQVGEGRNALAVILGHELAHFYKDHFWAEEFLHDNKTLGIRERSREIREQSGGVVAENERTMAETEADVAGGFAGYIAGYNTIGVSARLIERIYATYGIAAAASEGYPSLADRQKFAEISEKKLERLVAVFEAGNRLMLVERYEDAARCFDYLTREFDFPSRELYNNAGVARALSALRLFDPDSLRYAYPFEFDAETRLAGERSGSRGFAGESKEQFRARLLSEAAADFTKAIERDKAYAPAYVNLALVQHLQGEETHKTEYHASEGRSLATKQGDRITEANASIALGIIHVHESRTVAQADFEKARAGSPQLAEVNLTLLAGKRPARGVAARRSSCPDGASPCFEKISLKVEKIGSITPIKMESDELWISGADPIEIKGIRREVPSILIREAHGEAWDAYRVESDGDVIMAVSTKPGYSDSTVRGLRPRASRCELLQKYGCPKRTRQARQGNYQVYEKAKIIVVTDADDRVTGWMIYKVEEEE
jgi:tetratricopeptide (TPR) repeat protein